MYQTALLLIIGGFTTFAHATVQAPECGIAGTVASRIHDCSNFPESTKIANGVIWRLVTRKNNSGSYDVEVWEDTKTGLLWGEKLGYNMFNFNSAVTIDEQDCHSTEGGMVINCRVITEQACQINVGGRIANGDITERSFGLPTIQEFITADENGIRDVVELYTTYSFLTSSLSAQDLDKVFRYSPLTGEVFTAPSRQYSYGGNVRCVGRKLQ